MLDLDWPFPLSSCRFTLRNADRTGELTALQTQTNRTPKETTKGEELWTEGLQCAAADATNAQYFSLEEARKCLPHLII